MDTLYVPADKLLAVIPVALPAEAGQVYDKVPPPETSSMVALPSLSPLQVGIMAVSKRATMVAVSIKEMVVDTRQSNSSLIRRM